MKRLILAFTIILFSISGFSQMGMDMSGSGSKKNLSMFMGYLSDVKCAESNNGISADGFNLKLNPEKHTVKCMKMPPCAMSGYGMFIKGNDGKYSFYRFDKKGAEMSKELLKKTKKKDNVSIHVMGVLKDNIIHVDTLQEM